MSEIEHFPESRPRCVGTCVVCKWSIRADDDWIKMGEDCFVHPECDRRTREKTHACYCGVSIPEWARFCDYCIEDMGIGE